MSPRRVLAEHSSRDLSDWQAYERVYGLDTAVDRDARFGVVAAAVWNASGGLPVEGSQQRRAAAPSDFFTRLSTNDDVEPEPTTHDTEPDIHDVDDVVTSEAERQTEALKSAWAMWGLQYNAAIRKAQEQGPPETPEVN